VQEFHLIVVFYLICLDGDTSAGKFALSFLFTSSSTRYTFPLALKASKDIFPSFPSFEYISEIPASNVRLASSFGESFYCIFKYRTGHEMRNLYQY
jgi:hypothetical protein